MELPQKASCEIWLHEDRVTFHKEKNIKKMCYLQVLPEPCYPEEQEAPMIGISIHTFVFWKEA